MANKNQINSDLTKRLNPWLDIPINEYEQHMASSSVGQLCVLNLLTNKYLKKIQPVTCLFIGISGGNGLEHIDKNISKKVIGIDINSKYLEECFKRYNKKILSLQLLALDITATNKRVCQADFIWAALILEYTGIEGCLAFTDQNISPGGHLIITIQCNNNLQSIGVTGINSIKKLGAIFNQVDPDLVLAKAKDRGYKVVSKEVTPLPHGKAFVTFHFRSGKGSNGEAIL